MKYEVKQKQAAVQMSLCSLTKVNSQLNMNPDSPNIVHSSAIKWKVAHNLN